MKPFLIGCLLALGLASEAFACGGRMLTPHNQTVDRYTTIKSGRTCSIGFRSLGPTEGVEIDQRPSHGSLTLGSIGRLQYRAHRGYAGPDQFAYTRYGKDARNRPSRRSVRVHITVVR